jgi:hypothetical protein
MYKAIAAIMPNFQAYARNNRLLSERRFTISTSYLNPFLWEQREKGFSFNSAPPFNASARASAHCQPFALNYVSL